MFKTKDRKPCRERKRLLSGDDIIFDCILVYLDDHCGILKYITEGEQKAGSLGLKPHTISYGFYWPDRPYVLYRWFDKEGILLGDYFNIADSIDLTTKEFSWRDLVVDILVLPDGRVEILDEDELPESLDKKLLTYIEKAKKIILKNNQRIIAEIENNLKGLRQ